MEPFEELLATAEFVRPLKVKEETVRRSHCVNGHYMGIVPLKLLNGQLRWSRSARDRLIHGGRNLCPQCEKRLKDCEAQWKKDDNLRNLEETILNMVSESTKKLSPKDASELIKSIGESLIIVAENLDAIEDMG